MCWSCFLLVAPLTESSAVFVIHLTNVFYMLFSCDSSLFTKKTPITGQQLALWLLTDLLFSLFLEAYITPFWQVLLCRNSAVIHKVAQCVIPMQIPYILIYFIHHIKTGPLHMVTSGQITVTISSHQFEMQGTKTQAKSWLSVLHNTISSKHPSQNSQ